MIENKLAMKGKEKEINEDLLGSSPKSVVSRLLKITEHQRRQSPSLLPPPLGLNDFIDQLPFVINDTIKRYGSVKPEDGIHDPISELFSRLHLDEEILSRYAYFDESKNYTRNLVSTDGKTYTLMLLCWNPGKASPIHDHPCDGCWMRMCTGKVRESRYKMVGEEKLECFSDIVYKDSQLAYIRDSMGYHKVGNPSLTKKSMTLHLYCPPFDKCRIWLDPNNCKSSYSSTCYHSRYGTLVRKNSSCTAK